MPSKDRARRNKKTEINKLYYEVNKDTILSDRKDKYDMDKRSNRHNEEYYRDIASSRVKSAESSKTLSLESNLLKTSKFIITRTSMSLE